MVEKIKVCPACKVAENSYKVSEIYMQSLMRLKSGDKAEAPVIDALQAKIPEERRDKLKGSRYYRELMESFAPPQGETQNTRAINPDWVAFALAFLSVYFLYQIFTTQFGVFWFAVGFAVMAYAAYFIFRKKIFAKYQVQKDQEAGSKGQVEKAIGVWMKLYYCAKDNIVFIENKSESIPLQEMRSYLLSKSK
jgi:hypothetical protein